MARTLRRKLARYAAERLLAGDATVIDELATLIYSLSLIKSLATSIRRLPRAASRRRSAPIQHQTRRLVPRPCRSEHLLPGIFG